MHKRERPAVPQKPHPQVLSKGDLQKPTIYSDKKPPIAAKSKITNNQKQKVLQLKLKIKAADLNLPVIPDKFKKSQSVQPYQKFGSKVFKDHQFSRYGSVKSHEVIESDFIDEEVNGYDSSELAQMKTQFKKAMSQ